MLLAVELPGTCPFECGFCRWKDQRVIGDIDAVVQAVRDRLAKCQEIYYTGIGETGVTLEHGRLVHETLEAGVRASTLGASQASVVEGLCRLELSVNKDLPVRATEAAANRAHKLGIPLVISMVDEGDLDMDPFEIMAKYSAVGFLVRPVQKAGGSKKTAGTYRCHREPNISMGEFPYASYKETLDKGRPVVCIGPYGTIVPHLGDPSIYE